jgi:hypothetical protein
MTEIVNALIDSTSLRLSRGFFLDAWIYVNYGDSGAQGFGGWVLFKKNESADGPNFAGYAITKIMEVAGVENWDAIKGKAIRVKKDSAGWDGKIVAIGHITKDIWYEPTKDFEQYMEAV